MGKPNVAVPHDIAHDTVRVVRVRTTDAIAPAGSVWSSVSDMSKWMRFMLDSGRVGNKLLIQPATFREIVAPQIRAPEAQYPALELVQPRLFTYALGWFVQEYNGETVWMHTGSIDGMSAIIGLLPRGTWACTCWQISITPSCGMRSCTRCSTCTIRRARRRVTGVAT